MTTSHHPSQNAPGSGPIYHLTPAQYYQGQPQDQPYQPQTLAQEGFIHCTSGLDMLVKIANAFFADLPGELLALEIDPARLTAPLKFEPPLPPPQTSAAGRQTFTPGPQLLFPHIYGPLNRQAIVREFFLQRDHSGQWRIPL